MRRLLLAVLLPAVLAGLLSGCSTTARAPAAAAPPFSCPPGVGAGDLPVSTADTGGRLVPVEAPTAARVCRYDALQGHPPSSGLAGQRDLTAGLDRLAADLQLAPRGTPGTVLCAPSGPGTPYLVRLTYPDGIVWLRADVQGRDVSDCSATWSATVSSSTAVGDVVAASYAAGSWTVPPLPDVDQRCVPDRTGRAAAAGSLLPAGATSLVLCRVAGDGVTRHRASAAEAAAVRDVLAAPVAVPFAQPCGTGTAPYELAATYPSGPAVLLSYAPGCTPEVQNGSLSAQLEPAGRRRLDALLATAF